MRTVANAALWDALWHSNKCHAEIQICSYDAEYPGLVKYTFAQDRIISCDTYSSLFADNDLGIGGTVASRLNCTLFIKDLTQSSVLPYRAMLEVFIRLTNGDMTTPWLVKGRYFIDTRQENKNAGTITITAYDGMINAEAAYSSGTDYGALDWVILCCTDMNWGYDRSLLEQHLDNNVTIPSTYTRYSYREILGFIAASYGGNFFLGEDNLIHFVSIGASTLPAAPNVDTHTGFFEIQDNGSNYITTLTVYAENGHAYTRSAGSNGKAIEVNIPWGTDALTVWLLLQIGNQGHVPFTARDARVDPRTEIGDVVNITPVIDGVVQTACPVQIETITRHFTDNLLSDISAPGGEGEHECSVKSSKYRSENRQMEYVRENYAEKSNNTPGVLLEPSTTIGDVLVTEDNGLGGRVAVWATPQSGGMPPPPLNPPGSGQSEAMIKAVWDGDTNQWVVDWYIY